MAAINLRLTTRYRARRGRSLGKNVVANEPTMVFFLPICNLFCHESSAAAVPGAVVGDPAEDRLLSKQSLLLPVFGIRPTNGARE